jgi:tight adherence protein C
MSTELLLSLIGVFACIAVATGALASFVLARTSPEQQRLKAVTATVPGLVLEQAQLTETPNPFLQKLTKALPQSPKDMSRLRKRLARAGIYGLGSAVTYAFAEMLLPVLVGGLILLIMGFHDGWILAILGGVFGYLAPGLWLQRRTNLRKKAIENGLPDALDLMIVCMEAGSSLDQAIVKASDELDISHPALAYEMRIITTEIRAGKTRLEAFRNFANRTGVDDVRSLVSMLIQTDRFGTSVAQALRTHASTARTKRRQLAEERAGKIGVKLVFPLVLCLFPAVYVVCIGPVIVKIYRAFF